MAKGKIRSIDLGAQGEAVFDDLNTNDFLYEHSTIKHPEFNVGDRVRLADGRVFRYAKCGVALTSQKYTCANGSRLAMTYSTDFVIAEAAAIGARSVKITVVEEKVWGPGDVYASPSGILAEDELRGGMIDLYRGDDRQMRGIIGNTALAVDGTEITIYLDASLRTAMQAGDKLEVLNNPYAYVVQDNSGWASVLGVSAVVVTADEYFWVQTWGLCRITPQAGAIGENIDGREFYSKNNGVIPLYDRIVAETTSAQHLGFLMEKSGNEAVAAAPFINLQINP